MLALGADSLPLLLLGIVLCDVALDSDHVTSLGVIYRLVPHARSRATSA